MVVDGGEDRCGSSNSSEKMNSDTEDSESEEVPVLPQSDSEEDINFEINDFVVTKFTTEEDNRCRLYLGKIMEIGISECNISFLRKKIGAKETYFYFPEVPDICKCKKNIIKKVKCADIRRGRIALKNASKTLLDKLKILDYNMYTSSGKRKTAEVTKIFIKLPNDSVLNPIKGIHGTKTLKQKGYTRLPAINRVHEQYCFVSTAGA
ncbi:hypothetical protein FQA39_LY09723 [Lamprigera yunnana]|nr:hypothetical protein FQA39_LY09723 [Lamprigera yunnana]